MSLKYRIHWIDDSSDFVESIKARLNSSFKGKPVKIDIRLAYDGRNILEVARSSAVDLFILDYTLDGPKGDELVRTLRENGELTEIVFYSQDKEVQNKFTSVYGVHICSRDDATEIICDVIQKFIDRFSHAAAARGMIIAQAIEVENRLSDILEEALEEMGDSFCSKFLGEAASGFERKRSFLQSILEGKIAKVKQSSSKRNSLIEKLEGLNQTLIQMKSEVIDQRNILAHSKVIFDKNGVLSFRKLRKRGKVEFDDKWKNTIRDNIGRHINNLNEIRKALRQ